MTTEQNMERPPALSVGILLSVATSALSLLCIFGVSGFLGLFGGAAMLE